jgi:hypothetical protein
VWLSLLPPRHRIDPVCKKQVREVGIESNRPSYLEETDPTLLNESGRDPHVFCRSIDIKRLAMWSNSRDAHEITDCVVLNALWAQVFNL